MRGRRPTAIPSAVGATVRGRAPQAVVIAILAIAAPARAHQTSVKYVDVTVEGRRATVALTVAPGDVTEPLGLPPHPRPTGAGAGGPPAPRPGAGCPVVAACVAGWLAVGPDPGQAAGMGAPCPVGRPAAAADADARFVVVRWQDACDADPARIALAFRALFAP